MDKENYIEHCEKNFKPKINKWYDVLEDIFLSKKMYKTLKKLSLKSKSKTSVNPINKDIFRCFKECPYDDLKVVIVGEQAYTVKGVADGLAFSYTPSNKNDSYIPPTLRNIFQEIRYDVYKSDDIITYLNTSVNPNLTRWAKQGILLLNRSLTSENRSPRSHDDLWKDITKEFIKRISDEKENIIFLLWG